MSTRHAASNVAHAVSDAVHTLPDELHAASDAVPTLPDELHAASDAAASAAGYADVAASIANYAAASTASYSLPFVGPGTYLIFGIVLLPVYVMILAWFLGDPRDNSKGLLGIGYLIGLTTVLWGGLLVATLVIGAVFF